MAFEKADTSDGGFAAATAYHRIGYVRGDPSGARGLNVRVDSYKSEADRQAGVKPFKTREFNGIIIDWGAGAPGAQLYAQIKASLQHDGYFTDATDVV